MNIPTRAHSKKFEVTLVVSFIILIVLSGVIILNMYHPKVETIETPEDEYVLKCTTGIESPPMNQIEMTENGFVGYNHKEGIRFYYKPPANHLCVVIKQ